MVKEITIGKTKKAYLTEEDIVETEEYFQQAVIISTEKKKKSSTKQHFQIATTQIPFP